MAAVPVNVASALNRPLFPALQDTLLPFDGPLSLVTPLTEVRELERHRERTLPTSYRSLAAPAVPPAIALQDIWPSGP